MVYPIIPPDPSKGKINFPLDNTEKADTIRKGLADTSTSAIMKESARLRKNIKRTYKTIQKNDLEYQIQGKYSNIPKHLKAPNLQGLQGAVKHEAATDELLKLWDIKNNRTLNIAQVKKSIVKQITSGVSIVESKRLLSLPFKDQVAEDKRVKRAHEILRSMSDYEAGSLEGQYTVATAVWNLYNKGIDEPTGEQLAEEIRKIAKRENNFINSAVGDEFADF